jgi:uncharacterized repeat protein (TIGR03803 family)
MNLAKGLIGRSSGILAVIVLGFGATSGFAQLFEADSGSGNILESTPDGFGIVYASGINEPVGLAFDAAGNLFVGAFGNGTVQQITPGGVQSTFASGLNKPWGLAFDSNGNLFVTVSGSGEVLEFTSSGAESTFASGLSEPLGLAFDAFGNLFIGTSTGAAGGGEILKFSPKGIQSTFATGLNFPSSLVFGAGGDLLVADRGSAHIYAFTPGGVKTIVASRATLGLALDAAGNLFSTDGASSILEFSASGTVSTFASGLNHSGLLAFAPFSILHTFSGPDGSSPQSELIQGLDGNLYGTTVAGGTGVNCAYLVDAGELGGCGTIFRITPSGTLTTLYNFCDQSPCADGAAPNSRLVQAANGDIYGTTSQGGSGAYCPYLLGCGTVFEITPSGALTTLYSFCSQSGCVDGQSSFAGLIQASNGDLYGTTFYGGSYDNHGTLFKITPEGSLTTLYSFPGECIFPPCWGGTGPEGVLVQGANGYLYGTTVDGGTTGNGGLGTVFKVTPSGTLTTIYSFCTLTGCPDGDLPIFGLVQGADGYLYGTTAVGGVNGRGTVFQITPSGALTTLYSFCSLTGCPDGAPPVGELIQATDGNLYGTTSGGGAGNFGTVFRITPSGDLTTLYSFCPPSQTCAANPLAGLLQATNGNLYGTSNAFGTVFRLSIGMSAFVKTLPAAGVVGEVVEILGTNLNGTTSVTFNGTPAMILKDAPTVIYAKVPAGATTGKVQVVTPSGTLTSNVAFEVAP